MKLTNIDPIIKAIEARQDNAEDLPPLTTGDFLRMLRKASEPKTGGIQLIIREDGTAEKYDDTYDLTIHCASEDEQKEVLKIMNQAAELRQLKPHGDLIDRDALGLGEYEKVEEDTGTLEISLGGLLEVYHKVKDAPAIIAREERN